MHLDDCALRLLRLAAIVGVAAFGLSACGATIYERHYFAAFHADADGQREPQQFYRLTVQGQSHFSNARYLTGYFDDHAISLFFNEIKAPANQRLFDESVKLPGASADSKLTPLTPTPETGAFVMIMSTNADAIASSIGSFAESQAVADSLTNLVNRDRIVARARSDAGLAVQKAEGAALAAKLDAHVQAAQDATTGSRASAEYLHALSALAMALGYAGGEFQRVEDARSWFALEGTRAGATP
jgi:hypothetical protein